MKLTDFSPYPRTVEGEKVPIHVEIDDALPPTVSLELDVHYEQADGQPAQKTLIREVPCQRIAMTAQGFKYRLEWTVDLKRDGLQEHLARIDFKLPKHDLKSMSPRTIAVVGIEITKSYRLKRIMLHEFSTREGFDPSALHVYLSKLTVEQRKVLSSSASASENPRGRLVIFISLYPPLPSKRRMYADWQKSGVGVFANATFSVFFCRDDVKLNVRSAQSTSPITLVCHTEYFYVCLGNPPTQAWLNPPKNNRRAPGWYNGLRPNQWLEKTNLAPPKFMIAALQPSAKVSYGVIWNSIYEAATGNNIMPGNSVHGIINTRGCWMLFRNFNWPIEVREKLDRIYRKVYRLADEQETNAVIAELKKKRPEGPEYDVEKPKPAPGQKPPDGPSSSFDKFRKYDRNWA
ncbi:MAG: hypothetical protein LC791_14390, partial [Acidobacteria bacterium]|nr:hypothetical protein [Acidobacteriota bacterium]